MRIIFDAPVTKEERAELSAWMIAHGNDHIRYITVGSGSVEVHGRHSRHKTENSGLALRHAGGMSADLDRALGRMRNTLAT